MRASFQRLGLAGLALLLTGQGPLPAVPARDPAMFAVAAADGEADAQALQEAHAAADWARWVEAIKQEAASQGISAATLADAFDGLTPSARVIALDRQQPERRASYQTYLQSRLTADKVARARDAAAQVQPVLAQIEADFGVPAAVVVGIWGMETHFGRNTGSFDVVRSLASLAFDGRREALFRRELLAALTMLDRGYVARDAFRGSWAGAVGQGQFLPSSVLRFGVDHDGDGRVDLWNSSADALASIANYLRANGWSQTGAAWGIAVSVPSALDRASIAAAQEPQSCKSALRVHSRPMPVQSWKALGLFNASARDWPADDALATLVEPDGPGGPAYLVTDNYRALLAYNCSNFYALSVALLSDSLI
jgi:membrane-bound lytic murein transglycosylase B